MLQGGRSQEIKVEMTQQYRLLVEHLPHRNHLEMKLQIEYLPHRNQVEMKLLMEYLPFRN